jgi:aspartate kinase
MADNKKIVVKFGGSSLADHERLLKAVVAVVNESKKGTKVAVVVSAMGKTTDVLMIFFQWVNVPVYEYFQLL